MAAAIGAVACVGMAEAAFNLGRFVYTILDLPLALAVGFPAIFEIAAATFAVQDARDRRQGENSKALRAATYLTLVVSSVVNGIVGYASHGRAGLIEVVPPLMLAGVIHLHGDRATRAHHSQAVTRRGWQQAQLAKARRESVMDVLPLLAGDDTHGKATVNLLRGRLESHTLEPGEALIAAGWYERFARDMPASMLRRLETVAATVWGPTGPPPATGTTTGTSTGSAARSSGSTAGTTSGSAAGTTAGTSGTSAGTTSGSAAGTTAGTSGTSAGTTSGSAAGTTPGTSGTSAGTTSGSAAGTTPGTSGSSGRGSATGTSTGSRRMVAPDPTGSAGRGGSAAAVQQLRARTFKDLIGELDAAIAAGRLTSTSSARAIRSQLKINAARAEALHARLQHIQPVQAATTPPRLRVLTSTTTPTDAPSAAPAGSDQAGPDAAVEGGL